MDEDADGMDGLSRSREAAASRVPEMGFVENAHGRAFQPYTSRQRYIVSTGSSQKLSALRVIVKKPLVTRLTRDIVETYQICNPSFKYSEALNPKRFLTSPNIGVLNDGYDNANSDLILSVNLVLLNGSQQRYIVKEMLGQGTFGQVAKCWAPGSNSYVAVKIIKNQPAYYQQAQVEVSLLKTLNQKFDPDDKHHIVRILDDFVYQHHLCISFEMLGSNLYELLKMNQFKGLSLGIIQVFSKQILCALVLMKDAGIIHCDLKPENILISASVKPAEIKVIDFGSACVEGRTIYSYIQSRYYRSPEVLLGYPYSTAIDMWSFGCIVAELFLGLPLFAGASEFDLLQRMIEVLCAQPPDNVLRVAKNTCKFFKHVGSIRLLENNEALRESTSAYRLLTAEEYEARESKKPVIGKRYLSYVKLEDIVANYPYRKTLSEEEMSKESLLRLALVDFLRGLIELDPAKRWSPFQASQHPFVTGEPFTGPYNPPSETAHIPVGRNAIVDHNPGGGHWLGAGLSPQVPASRGLRHNSPHFQMATLSHGHGGSFGSVGSYGSYNDNAVLSSSYGSYGDGPSIYTYFTPGTPSGLNIQAQLGGSLFGASPDTRYRPQFSHGTGFGISPAGTFGPMSLGASPSQFTPPSSQIQVPNVSPGKYGPTSPSRGCVHGSPLGKTAAMCQYNKRSSLGQAGTSVIQPPDSVFQHWQGHHVESIGSGYFEVNSGGHTGSPQGSLYNTCHPSWRQQRGGNGFSQGLSLGIHQSFPSSLQLNTSTLFINSSEASCYKPECISLTPDPGDWDPNYSEELLLQEDSSEVNYVASRVANMRHGHATDAAATTSGVNRVNRGYRKPYPSTNFTVANQRTDGMLQAHSVGEGSPVQDRHGGFIRPHSIPSHHVPPFSQNFPSRFGQQPAYRVNQLQSSSMYGERNVQKSQMTRSSYAKDIRIVPRITRSAVALHGEEGLDCQLPPSYRHPLLETTVEGLPGAEG